MTNNHPEQHLKHPENTMSREMPTGTLSSADASVPGSEKNASNATTPASTAPLPARMKRSCVVCRSRKVRCDKQSPCSNCRRAGIPCTLPSADRPPRWARRLANNAGPVSNSEQPHDVVKVMDRLQKLESLVKELGGQLEQAHAAQYRDDTGQPMETTPPAASMSADSSVQSNFGRLVLQDAKQSRYVSSGFWSRVSDELDELRIVTGDLAEGESDSSMDEASFGRTPSTRELERRPSDRHAFLFRHNLSPSSPDLREFHPLPSQISFLLDVFSENVNYMAQIVHMPTVTKMVRDLRGNPMARLTLSNEALMFSIYYAAVISMEEEDVIASFGSSKADLSLKYRLGLEHALAQADFLEAPDIILVQALAIFLFLVRRHDSPRYAWMMTGLVIRMAQYLGLQRDGSHFDHLTPFEIELRRKVWWALCMLDTRASEDQGTEPSISSGSFDTKIPININVADLDPETRQTPAERDGMTDMTFCRIYCGMEDSMRRMITKGLMDASASISHKTDLLNEIYQRYEQAYLQCSTKSDSIAYWVSVTIARLVMAKMTLIVFLPVLFSSSGDNFSDDIRTKLLISAIEVAEYNHALNAEQACRQWRWIYQTYTHWHAIVYLLIDICRREWSPMVERAWVALHSKWLIPAKTPTDKNVHVWVPLRKLMAKARKHRDAELRRLRADRDATVMLELEDRKMPLPSSARPLPNGSIGEPFFEPWHQLVGLAEEAGENTQSASEMSNPGLFDSTSPPSTRSIPDPGNMLPGMTFALTTSEQPVGQFFENAQIGDAESGTLMNPQIALGQNTFSGLAADTASGSGFVPWLWDDAVPSTDVDSWLGADPLGMNMEPESEVNWYNWVESAKGME